MDVLLPSQSHGSATYWYEKPCRFFRSNRCFRTNPRSVIKTWTIQNNEIINDTNKIPSYIELFKDRNILQIAEIDVSSMLLELKPICSSYSLEQKSCTTKIVKCFSPIQSICRPTEFRLIFTPLAARHCFSNLNCVLN